MRQIAHARMSNRRWLAWCPLVNNTHFISDLSGGIGSGFRFHNDWLAVLTSNAFPVTFYSGDALGTFNSWMRLLTGLFFGIGLVWFAYPRLHAAFAQNAYQIESD